MAASERTEEKIIYSATRFRTTIDGVESKGGELQFGDGDGGGGGMELARRVSKLEDKLDGVRDDVSEIKGKLSQMPTSLTYVLMTFAIMAGTLGIARLVFMWTQ